MTAAMPLVLLQDQLDLLESGKKQLLMEKSELLEQLANEKGDLMAWLKFVFMAWFLVLSDTLHSHI